jgi:hypothetical protein
MEGTNIKYKVIEGGKEIEEKDVKEILEVIKEFASSTGGFRLSIEKEVPKYIVIARGKRPGPSYDYRILDILITDGEIEFISEKHLYNYPTQNDHLYKYKIVNAQFAIVVQWYGNDYEGSWREWTTVLVYGDCPFMPSLMELQKELEI